MSITGDTRRALVEWLDGQGLEPGHELDITPVQGGRSHVMFRLRRGESTWILRRPATIALSTAAQGLRREFQVLTALEGSPVPHPTPIAQCGDESVIGAAFYLMADVAGINPSPRLLADADPALTRGSVFDAMTDALAQLHEVDWMGCGLAEFGRPEGFHQRQAERWAKQLRSYGGPEFPEAQDVFSWLQDNAPDSWQATLMHGDYHMLNVLIAADAPARVTAILDWETSTIGDPLLDLAGFIEICAQSYPAAEGWPGEERISSRYFSFRGLERDTDLRYYKVLYNYRLTVLLEGIHQRSIADPDRPTDHDIGARARRTAARAKELIA